MSAPTASGSLAPLGLGIGQALRYLTWMGSPSSDPNPTPDKRKHQRIPIVLPLSCEIEGANTFYAAAKDISLRGARIQCFQPPPVGTKVTVVVQLPGAAKTSRLPGTVRWTMQGAFGVQFEPLGLQDACSMATLLGRAVHSKKLK